MVKKKDSQKEISKGRSKTSTSSVKHERKKVFKRKVKTISPKDFPSLELKTEHDIAMDFAVKVYKKFDKIIKSIVLFGSTAKQTQTQGSDIDIIIVVDDAAIRWDPELVTWYREELDKILRGNPYKKSLHINTIKLTTWWQDLMRGDPVILNILRYGEAMLDMAGFFQPLKVLMLNGKIKATPEASYTCLQRAPMHLARSRAAELQTIEGIYWSMVDSAHAALISANETPPSPEHVFESLKKVFVDSGKLKMKFAVWFRDLHFLHKSFSHGKVKDIKGMEIDEWQQRAEDFMKLMAELVQREIDN